MSDWIGFSVQSSQLQFHIRCNTISCQNKATGHTHIAEHRLINDNKIQFSINAERKQIQNQHFTNTVYDVNALIIKTQTTIASTFLVSIQKF